MRVIGVALLEVIAPGAVIESTVSLTDREVLRTRVSFSASRWDNVSSIFGYMPRGTDVAVCHRIL